MSRCVISYFPIRSYTSFFVLLPEMRTYSVSIRTHVTYPTIHIILSAGQYPYPIQSFPPLLLAHTESESQALTKQVFYAPLLDILEDKALTVIFANIEDLLLTATQFLSELEERQKSCRLYVDVIGDILEEHMGKMRVYMVSPGLRALQSLLVLGGPIKAVASCCASLTGLPSWL